MWLWTISLSLLLTFKLATAWLKYGTSAYTHILVSQQNKRIPSYLIAFLPAVLPNFCQLGKEGIYVFHLDVNHVPESSQIFLSRDEGIFGDG